MKTDNRDNVSDATNKIREIINRDDVEVHFINHSMLVLYTNKRLVAYCFSHNVALKNADIKYKILAPKNTEINYKHYEKLIEISEPINIKKIKRQVAMNIKHQEVALAILKNNDTTRQVLEKS